LAFANRSPARVKFGGPSRTEDVASESFTISAMSKLPSRSGLAKSRMPGCVVPGPFGGGLDVLGGVVRMGGAEVADVGDAEGPPVDTDVAGARLGSGADRGRSGASW
jgi:hypothetical protein